MFRSIATLVASLALFLIGTALVVWVQLVWSSAHRGQVEYLLELISLPLIFISAYALMRRHSS